MRLWTVYEPRNPASAVERADKTIFVKDGFSWPGLLFALPWLLIHRLWLGTLIYLLITAAGALAGTFLPLTEDAGFVLGLLGSLYVGFEGNDLRRRKLAGQGFVQAGSVIADDRTEAEHIFFTERGAPDVAAAPPKPPRAPATAMNHGVNHGANNDVLGLFPRPEGPR
jgi:hypothetical protein